MIEPTLTKERIELAVRAGRAFGTEPCVPGIEHADLAAFALAQMEGKEAAEAERETLRAVAITAERLCRYDGSKAMTAKGHYYDAQKAMEFSDRLHELLAEWRKGQKEGRW